MSISRDKTLKRASKEITNLATLKAYLGIQRRVDNWDAIVIPNGNGVSWVSRLNLVADINWDSTLIEKTQDEDRVRIKKFRGYANCGDRATASLLSVLHPLIFLTNCVGTTKSNGYDLYVASKSKYLVEGLKQNNPVWHSRLEKNRELWMAIYAAKRRGVVIHPRLLLEDAGDFHQLSKKFKETT